MGKWAWANRNSNSRALWRRRLESVSRSECVAATLYNLVGRLNVAPSDAECLEIVCVWALVDAFFKADFDVYSFSPKLPLYSNELTMTTIWLLATETHTEKGELSRRENHNKRHCDDVVSHEIRSPRLLLLSPSFFSFSLSSLLAEEGDSIWMRIVVKREEGNEYEKNITKFLNEIIFSYIISDEHTTY